MFKSLLSAMLLIGVAAATSAQAQQSPADQIASQLRFWADGVADQPVYYGQVKNAGKDNYGRYQVYGHYRCLALAFIRYDKGVFEYSHKMWPISSDGSCHYDDVMTRKVDNHGLCVADSQAPPPKGIGTTLMTKNNIDVARSRFRVLDTNRNLAGEAPSCVPGGVGLTGVVSVKIENGHFKMLTNRPLSYEVDITPRDPLNPPSDPLL